MLLVATIHPSISHMTESLSTLKFAARCCQVELGKSSKKTPSSATGDIDASHPPIPALRRAKSSSSNTNSGRPRSSAAGNSNGTTHTTSGNSTPPVHSRRRSTSYGAAAASPRGSHNVATKVEAEETQEEAQEKKRQQKVTAVCDISCIYPTECSSQCVILDAEPQTTCEYASHRETGEDYRHAR